MSIKQSAILAEEGKTKVQEHFLTRQIAGFSDDADNSVLVPELSDLPQIEAVGEYVVIRQDLLSSTIVTQGDSTMLPTGTVVGVSSKSSLAFGDRVWFNKAMKVCSDAEYPGYDKSDTLIVIPEKHIFFKLPS